MVYCLLPGTKITLLSGVNINIEELKLEDTLIVCNIQGFENQEITNILNKEINTFKVIKTNSLIKNIWKNYVYSYYSINDKLYLTGDHIIFIKRDGNYVWKYVSDIILNDQIYNINGIFETINDIRIINKETFVYNLEVNKYFNFFANDILVHNGGKGGKGDDCSSCSSSCGGESSSDDDDDY